MEKYNKRYFLFLSLSICLVILIISTVMEVAAMDCKIGTCSGFSDPTTRIKGVNFISENFESNSSITVSTDKSSYNQGDSITISGKVNGQLPNTGIIFKILNPSMNLISIFNIPPASDGDFSNTVLATGPMWITAGKYTIVAQYGPNTSSNSTVYFSGGNGQYNVNSLIMQSTSKGTLDVGFLVNPTNPKPGDNVQMKIYFIHKISMAVQNQIDYKVTVTQDNNKVFSTPMAHTANGSVNIPLKLISGTYDISVEIDGILFLPITPETVTFSLASVNGQNYSVLTPLSNQSSQNQQGIASVPEFPFASTVLLTSIISTILIYRAVKK